MRIDLNRLRSGVDPALWGPCDCAPVPVDALPAARVIWLNRRWWANEGLDLDRPRHRYAVEETLLANFGVRSREGAALGNRVSLAADRYGSSFGSRHGGSGRCGMSGRLIAKGIGRTPLAGSSELADHADGCLSMAEAVREVIAGEIADAELPWGAVPGVAILATGQLIGKGEAILIRPTFLRAAHFERSLYFGSAGTPGSDQHLDALRVRSMIEAASAAGVMAGFPGLLEMFGRFADQIGAAQAHRLWQGKFLSSNATICGELADFGSFRAVSTWNGFFGEPEEVFGREEDYLEIAFSSVVRAFHRQGKAPARDIVEAARAALRPRVQRAFDASVVNALGLRNASTETRAAVVALIRAYFRRQQRQRFQVADVGQYRMPWIHALLTGEGDAGDDEENLVSGLLKAVEADREIGPTTILERLANWTCPRRTLSYEASTRTLADLPARIADQVDGGVVLVGQTIDRMLATNWRNLGAVPPDIRIAGHGVCDGLVVSYGASDRHGGPVAVVTASILAENEMLQRGKRVTRTVRCHSDASKAGARVTLDGRTIDLPPASFHYPALAPRWRCRQTLTPRQHRIERSRRVIY